jgi:hypothetical protein
VLVSVIDLEPGNRAHHADFFLPARLPYQLAARMPGPSHPLGTFAYAVRGRMF